MRAGRFLKAQTTLGVIATTVLLATPALAAPQAWEGVETLPAIMPRWSWDGIHQQQRFLDMSDAERNQALRSGQMPAETNAERMMREGRETSREEMRTNEQQPQIRRGPETGTEEQPEDQEQIRKGPGNEPTEGTEQQEMKNQGDQQPQMRQPQSGQPPAGTQNQQSANPVVQARGLVSEARLRVQEKNWDSALELVSQAENQIGRLRAGDNQMAQKYLQTLRDDLERARASITTHSPQASNELDLIESRIRAMTPAEPPPESR